MLKRIALLAVLAGLTPVVIGTAYAAVPQTINYQGYLTNSSGQPVNGPVNLTFGLYDVVSGGSALWSEVHAGVVVTNGVYSVVLGNGSPTPVAITLPFDAQYYLGISVNAGVEMTPRQALTVVPYAFRTAAADTAVTAANATNLGGQPASSFATASHTHSGSQITSTVANATNSDTVDGYHAGTASDNVPVSNGTVNINLNADLVDGKHATDFVDVTSAQSISGAKTFSSLVAGSISGNAATATQLAANPADCTAGAFAYAIDASGNLTCSTNGASLASVNAATLNSMTSSEIIAAAVDERRSPISACGTTISTRGSYYVTQSLSTTGTCISITADDVTLDLMGFALSGDGGASDYGILLTNASNVEIRNGTVKGFGHGIYEPYGTGAGHSNSVINIRAMSNTGKGIFIDVPNAQIRQCTVFNNADGGIRVAGGAIVMNNSVFYNGGVSSIYASNGSYIANNSVYNNYGTYGINASQGSNITNNSVAYNQHWGILAAGGMVSQNMIQGNNSTGTAGEGGLNVVSSTVVRDNILDGNLQYNLYVSGSTNTIERNHITNSTTGIYFFISNNVFSSNNVWGHTADYAGNIPQNPIPIMSLPFTISSPGYYYLTGNLSSTTSGITVNASNVTIDLNGFSIFGGGVTNAAYNGISISVRANVEIRNGTVSSFGNYGIWEQGNGSGHRIINAKVINNKQDGVVLSGSGHLIKDSVVSGNTRYGINVAGNDTITGNTVFGHTNNTGIVSWGNGNSITGNVVYGNLYGISGADYHLISGNTAYGNTSINISSCAHCIISNNVAP